MSILRKIGNGIGNTLIFTASTVVGATVGSYGIYANPLNLDEQKNIYASAAAGAGTAVITAATLSTAKGAISNAVAKRQTRKLAKKIQKESEELVNQLL